MQSFVKGVNQAVTDHPPHEWGQPRLDPAASQPSVTPATEAQEPGPTAQSSYEPEPTLAPPRHRPRRTKPRIWPWVTGLVVIVTVVLGGCVSIMVNLVRAPIETTNAFVANLDNGEYEVAYNSLCQATRSELTLAEFVDHQSASEAITDYTLTPAAASVGELTTVSGTIDISGEPRNVTFDLVREGGQWRVCTYDLMQ